MSEGKSIPVRAIREGYFNNEIKTEGKKFFVQSEQELGSWMERLDGGKNPAENRHLLVEEAVKNKVFKKLDASKLIDETKIKTKAEKEVADSQKDAPSETEVTGGKPLTPAQKGAATKAAKAKAAAKKSKASDNTKGLI